MAELSVYDLNKKEVGKFSLEDGFLQVPVKEHLIQEIITAHLAARRQGTHSTKGTSEVNGSTRKLFKQKGTGNARAGSKKAVQRRHGATQFGPKPRDYSKKVNKKVMKSGLNSMLAHLINENRLHVIEAFRLDAPKAKDFRKIQQLWELETALWVEEPTFEENFLLSVRNFQAMKLVNLAWLNVYDLAKYKQVFITKAALEKLAERLRN